jgi:acyl-CoA dehydrogenase
MRKGEIIGSLALSEPDCGSNLGELALTAQKCSKDYVLAGVKTWVSHGDIADWHAVLARTGEGPGGLGLSFFMVPATSATATGIELLAPRAFASVTFDGCTLPGEALVGQSGAGFQYALEILKFYRVSVGSAAIGFCRRGVRAALEWCRNRKVAGSSLIQKQLTTDKLAQMAVYLDSASLLVARSAWEFDNGVKDVVAHASMAKLHATDGAAQVIDDVVQLFGAAGLVAGSLPEQLYRQIRSMRIYEGTSEIQKMVIAGAMSRPA